MIIDCHAHYTTTPPALEEWRKRQVESFNSGTVAPKASELRISDDQIRESIESNQLQKMNERQLDVAIFSPRASFMAHHIGNFQVSQTWSAICNTLCHRAVSLFPERFVGAAMLPQSPGEPPEKCIPELRRCIEEYGFVAVNINPDPSGGHWNDPPLTDRWWYPLYEQLVEYDIPAMLHVSTSCNDAFHTTGAHYLNADTTAFMQCMTSQLFKDFPTLRFVIPHGGGAVPYHWGRYRGIAKRYGFPDPTTLMGSNIYFDTCVYHQPGMDLLLKVVPTSNVLFASEMLGAVRGADEATGIEFDDTRRYVDASGLSGSEKQAVFENNVRRVYPRLNAALGS